MLNRHKGHILATSLLVMAAAAAFILLALPVRGSGRSPGSYAPASAYDPDSNRYLLVFTDVDQFMVPAIYGIFVRPDASPEGTPFRISDTEALVPEDTRPAVAYDIINKSFLVAWSDVRSGSSDIYAGILNSSGEMAGQAFAVSGGPGEANAPVVAFAPEAGSFMVAWQDTGMGDSDIFARTVTWAAPDAPALMGAEAAAYKAPGEQTLPSITYRPDGQGGGHFFLAFEDQAPDAPVPTISGQFMDPFSGAALLPVSGGLDISGETAGYAPSVTATASDTAPFMVAWHGPFGELRVRFMDAEGSVQPPLDHVFEPEGALGPAWNVRAATDSATGRSVLIWQETVDGQADIYASFIEPGDNSGSVYHVRRVAGDGRLEEMNPSVSYNSRMPSFLVAYESTDSLELHNILLETVSDPEYPEITVDDPVFPYEDLAMEYPGVLFNTSVSHTLNVYNDSPYAALNISYINASGPFSLTGENCTLEPLAPEGSPCSVTVEFSPMGRGYSTGTLSIVSDDPNEPETSLYLLGSGLAPEMEVTDTSQPPDDLLLDFGTVPIGQMSEGTITVRNTGDNTMAMGRITGASPGFGVLEDNCSGRTLMSGEYCTVVVFSSPLHEGRQSGTIWITSDAPGTSEALMALSAEGAIPGMALDEPGLATGPGSTPEEIVFGGVLSGTEASRYLSFRNTGKAPLTVYSSAISGEGFSITEDRCSGSELGQGDTCGIIISFAPDDTLNYSGLLLINSNDSRSPAAGIGLYGTGARPIAAVHAGASGGRDLDFGEMDKGLTATLVIKITNLGKAPLVTGKALIKGKSFAITNNSCAGASLPYASSCEIGVAFSPMEAQVYRGGLVIPTNDPDEPGMELTLSGTGTLPLGAALGRYFYGYEN